MWVGFDERPNSRGEQRRSVGVHRKMDAVSNPELVTAYDLDQWSESLAAKSTLPVLVRRLILATAPVTEVTMRGREGVGLPGWDGLVHCDVDDAHVPRGASGWELGTSGDPRRKAQSDMRDRIRAPRASTRRPPRTSR
jgi:hypothetical protein